MPKTKISEYSATANSNTDIGGINVDEGCAPSGINDAIRTMMAQLKNFQTGTGSDSFNGPVGSTTASTGAFTTLSATGVTTVQAGTVSLPAITTSGDTNTGIFFPAADTIAFTEGGAEAMRITSAGNVGIGTTSPSHKLVVVGANSSTTSPIMKVSSIDQSSGAVALGDGSSSQFGVGIARVSSANAFGAGGLGFYTQDSANSGGFYWYAGAGGFAGQTKIMTLTSGGALGVGITSPITALDVRGSSEAALTLGTTSTPYGRVFADATAVTINGLNGAPILFSTSAGTSFTERARIDSSGNLLVGTTSSDGRLAVKASGSAGSTDVINAKNSSGTLMLQVRDDGLIVTSTAGAGPYALTTATAANMVVTATGEFRRSTSSLKYKTTVQDATHGLADVLKLRPVTYKGKNDGETIFGGLIAEEVHEAGLTEFVQYSNDGTPDALAYGQMVSLAFKAIQELKALNDTLTARITALEGN